jgi:hypothetical protein
MSVKTFEDSITESICAAFSGIWIPSYEHEDAVRVIADVCRRADFRLLMWDADLGTTYEDADGKMQSREDNPRQSLLAARELAVADYAALTRYREARAGGGKADEASIKGRKERTVIVLKNIHLWFDPILLQQLQHMLEEGRSKSYNILVLANDSVKIPPELEKMFLVLDHDLPGPDELWDLASHTDADATKLLPKRESAEGRLLVNAASGMTRLEAIGAFSLSVYRHNDIKPDTIWEIKSRAVKKSGLLEMHQGTQGFDSLGGLNNVKGFCRRLFTSPNRGVKAAPRGVVLLGVPGTGKSAFAKCLGYEVGLPTVTMNIGALMGGIVGETESNTRRALKIIDACAPCILFVDQFGPAAR